MVDASESIPHYRPGARVAVSYFLGCAERITRILGEDLGPTLVFLGALWIGARQEGPRRPVSVYRLADVLNVPYETTRRYANRLVEAGLAERGERGVLIRPEVFERPQFEPLIPEAWAATEQLRAELEALKVELPAPTHPPGESDLRAVTRLSAAHFLKCLGHATAALKSDPLTALVFLEIYDANARPVREDPSISLSLPKPDAVRADALRQPTTVYRVAKTLRLPYETTRRHALRLVREGWCRRVADEGMIVAAEALLRPEMTKASELTWKETLDLVIRAADHGLGPIALTPGEA